MKSLFTILTVVAFFSSGIAQVPVQTLIFDFELASGSWTGSLTYLDYSTGKPFTMPADLEMKRISGSNAFLVSNIYPNEKSANGKDTLRITDDGVFINKAKVSTRRVWPDGTIDIVTEETGKDGNDGKMALFRHTYTIGKTTFSKRKEVQFEGTTTWILRHEYSYKRKSVP
jgi:hypothetical protein